MTRGDVYTLCSHQRCRCSADPSLHCSDRNGSRRHRSSGVENLPSTVASALSPAIFTQHLKTVSSSVSFPQTRSYQSVNTNSQYLVISLTYQLRPCPSRATAEPGETFSWCPSGENIGIFLNGAFLCTLYFRATANLPPPRYLDGLCYDIFN